MTTDALPSPPVPLALKAEEGRGWSRLRWVLLLALMARLAAVSVWSEHLTDDRDGYLSLAQGLAAGRGYAVPGTETPTAYRPPLYPLLLMPSATPLSGVWTAVLHVVLGLLTVWLTWRLAVRLTAGVATSSSGASIPVAASVLVALDPILLRYAAFPMTETLAACLVTGLLVAVSWDSRESVSRRQSVLAGGLFGLAALCRPTVWAFAGLAAVRKLATSLTRRERRRSTNPARDTGRRAMMNGRLVVVAAAVVVLPWGLRNLLVFGRPILMTTHGGYTLLLGNNPEFYREVVDQPWGTVWDGSRGGGQAEWADRMNREMDAAGVTGEVARDAWMNDRAWSNISSDPGGFARACWLRLRRYWGVAPIEGASSDPQWMRWGVSVFYSFVLIGAVIGLVSGLRDWSPAWWPSLLMVCAFTAVHLVYWTNTRMRAPIVPVIAILAAAGWCRMLKR